MKLKDCGREGVYLGQSDETSNQHWVYAPDLGRAQLEKTIDFDENRKGGELDLKIRKGDELYQGEGAHLFTSSAPPLRKAVGRPKKKEAVPLVEKLPRIKNNFVVEISTKLPAEKSSPDFPSPAREIKNTTTIDVDPSTYSYNEANDNKVT